MGRSYNLKKSPINKGTAAKPSPTKVIGTGAAMLIAAGITAATGATTAAVQGKKNRKAQEEISQEQKSDNIIANMQQGLTKDVSMKKTNLLGD